MFRKKGPPPPPHSKAARQAAYRKHTVYSALMVCSAVAVAITILANQIH